MNIVADVGNTRVKLGVFEGNKLLSVNNFSVSELNLITDFINKQKVDRAIVASVLKEFKAITDHLKASVPLVIEFSSKTVIPIKNLYTTPDTLGNDRIPPVIAAQQERPNSTILVIDAGTCLKYNFLTRAGEFIGGAISPGLTMRFQALNSFTSKLPLITADPTFAKLIGTNTTESILAGVQTAAIAEVNEIINQYKIQFPDLNVFLTGGDLVFFEKRIKNAIFVESNLVLKGLNIILNYNA